MFKPSVTHRRASVFLASSLLLAPGMGASAADKALLDVLLENGAITQAQYEQLLKKDAITAEDVVAKPADGIAAPAQTEAMVAEEVERVLDEEFSVRAAQGGKGFSFSTQDGNWQTNLQWRGQLRYTNPFRGDPRSLSNFDSSGASNFEMRRLRMKIGGHGFQPWLKYYFEVDLQPSRDPDDSAASASARVIDWRVDVARWDWGGLRVGQWKIDYNRERVDSSGRQQFVERSIVNRIFTVDRQVGVQLRGRAFKETAADLRWYAGIFNGEGRGVRNPDNNMMYVGRLQWNFLGRDLGLRQTDVEFTEKPTGSFAIGRAGTEGQCTRWSSSGCGNRDGFTSPAAAAEEQFKVEQGVQEFA
ncbi:MAG: porin, partial [Pseudomonadota bacterium]